mmetsp:Transcript_56638/g.82876  ORF Transcript_56638/g.82876 Transcript_56638/m.82876 type:complete len:116 (+) Transcript_56638:118-465(+)
MAKPVKLKFLFANHDGLSVIQETDLSRKVEDVKADLIANWPNDIPKSDSPDNIRLICMGQGILKNPKTLEELNVPVFEHPTPVNVSIIPNEVARNSQATKKQAKASKFCSGCCIC